MCSGLYMRRLFRLPPSRSAQVRLSLPRSIPTCTFSQVLPGSPRKLVISCDFVGFRDFLGEPGCYFLRFCGVSGISWENLGVIFCAFVGFPGFPGRTWVLFSRFCRFPGFPGRTWVLFSALLWSFRDFLGEPGWKQLGMGLGELQELVRGKVAGGWPAILTRNF